MSNAFDHLTHDLGDNAAPVCEGVNSEGSAQLRTIEAVQAFIVGGKAVFTLVSQRTGARFTYRVNRAKETRGYTEILFVSVLTGSDNNSDYTYFGQLKQNANGVRFEHGRKSTISATAPSAKAFAWFASHLVRNQLPDTVQVWHEGRCCRCARRLTVPSSIANGIGPECAGKASAW